ncbi:hypothetical protein C8F01DRAFT_99150, partial [Mycena amicta]
HVSLLHPSPSDQLTPAETSRRPALHCLAGASASSLRERYAEAGRRARLLLIFHPLPSIRVLLGTPWSTTKSRRRSDSEASTASRYSFSSTVETTLGYGWTNASASAGAGSAMPSLVGIHPFSASAGTSVQSVPPRVPKKAVRVTAYAPALSEKAALAAIDRARDEAEEQRGGELSAPAYREKDAAQLFGVRLRDVPANAAARAEATTSVITVAPPYEP